ncbi:spherulin-1A [Calycina marina]|uniref:Spherulin-1A n=1 Tax=Calycina marina TaxID=1763456 RepID=A0A9P8CJD4_9HELO|nr:spherulin-1A [Calycina marina]
MLPKSKQSTILLALLSIIPPISAVDETHDPATNAKLLAAATELDRQKILSSDTQWIFDFHAQQTYSYSPGSVINANAATFPAMQSTGMTLAMLNLGPCAMLPPHLHPRATNVVVAVEGMTTTYMVEENGARAVTEVLSPGKMTIFPRGSLHTMQNMGCGNATLVSALDSSDTGTLNVINQLANLPNDIVQAGFGNTAAAQFWKNVDKSQIPGVGSGSNLGSADCIAACKSGQKVGAYEGR